jgi:hypothetical protein
MKALMAASEARLNKRIEEMNERIQIITLRIQGQVAEDMLVSKFENGQKIEYYHWTQSYSYKPGRRCFASGKLLIPGSQVYKGTCQPGRQINVDVTLSRIVYPAVIWISKEEFVMRRLKGQL